MNQETLAKIKQWIFDNHEHHYEYEKWANCQDNDSPYVNSLELEKFLEGLVEKKPKRKRKRSVIVQKSSIPAEADPRLVSYERSPF